jgi:cell division transport system permease protein
VGVGEADLSFLRAFIYFFREALTSIRRSWKVSLLAVLTIAVSLFLGGFFLLLSGNLSRIVGEWRRDAKVVVYMNSGDEAGFDDGVLEVAWVTGVEEISSDEASRRFAETFPTLGQLLTGWEQEPLPRSLEIGLDLDAVEASRFRSWLAELRGQPGVQMVDDDRQWLRQLETLVAVLRGLGILIGGILLAAAVFTIGSVIKLTAYL